MKTCATGKVRFGSEKAAGARLVQIKIRRYLHGRVGRREQNIYRCPSCHGWHLTSHPR